MRLALTVVATPTAAPVATAAPNGERRVVTYTCEGGRYERIDSSMPPGS